MAAPNFKGVFVVTPSDRAEVGKNYQKRLIVDRNLDYIKRISEH